MTNPFRTNNASPTQAAAPAAAPAAQAPAPTPAAAPQTPNAGSAAIGGVAPAAGSDPFADPSAGGDGAKISADLGQALLLRPTEYIPTMNTSHGTTDAVRADWIVLTGPSQGQVRTGSLIFQKVLKDNLHRIMGTATPMMVAVLALGEAKNGNSAPYLFQAADVQTKELAAQAAKAHNWI